jgi:hypothetical protein
VCEEDLIRLSLTTWHPLSTKVDTNFANKRGSLSHYCSRGLRPQSLVLVFLYRLVVTRSTGREEGMAVQQQASKNHKQGL